jgi:DNA-binding response OmpR family regulator
MNKDCAAACCSRANGVFRPQGRVSNKMARLLIVDDDRRLLGALKQMLSRHDHVVDSAETAPEAVEMAQRHHYDFIFVDYCLPGKDGLWFMRSAKIPEDTRVILMTAFLSRELVNRMFDLGAVGYVMKPPGEEEILRQLSFHNDKNRSAQERCRGHAGIGEQSIVCSETDTENRRQQTKTGRNVERANDKTVDGAIRLARRMTTKLKKTHALTQTDPASSKQKKDRDT